MSKLHTRSAWEPAIQGDLGICEAGVHSASSRGRASRLPSCTETRKTKETWSGCSWWSHRACHASPKHLRFCLSRYNLNCFLFSENISRKPTRILILSVHFLLSSLCNSATKHCGLQRSSVLSLPSRQKILLHFFFLMQSLSHSHSCGIPTFPSMPFHWSNIKIYIAGSWLLTWQSLVLSFHDNGKCH